MAPVKPMTTEDFPGTATPTPMPAEPTKPPTAPRPEPPKPPQPKKR